MKKIKIFTNERAAALIGLFLVAFIACCIISCNKKNFGNNIANRVTVVSNVAINTTDTLYLLQGKDSTLSYTVTPDSAYERSVTWTTSDSTIVAVRNGVVQAVSVGTATITATSTDGSLQSSAIVVDVIDHITEAASISFTNLSGDTSIYEGDSIALEAAILPSNATYKTLKWTSSDPSIATVSSSGLIKAIVPGTAKISAEATDGSGVSVSVDINVLEVVPIQTIAFTSAFPDGLSLGNTYTLAYSVTPANATTNTLVWTSSDPTIISVTQGGVITAVAAGAARITVTSKNDATISAYIDLTVIAGKIDDEFTGTTTPWYTPTSGATSLIQNGQFIVTMALSGTKYRGDFSRKGGVVLNAGTYPIIAFKMLRPSGAAGGANVTFDTNLGSFGNGSNHFSTLTASDGTTVYYYNIATGTFGSGTTLSTTATTTLTTFQLKIADLVLTSDEVAAGNNIYYVDWVKSFKSLDDLQADINN